MAHPALPDYRLHNPPAYNEWHWGDITKPLNPKNHTPWNVLAPNPMGCAAWREEFGPFWGDIKVVPASGIYVRYGGPGLGSRQPPGRPRQGIGIKWRGQGDTWNGFLKDNVNLHTMEFLISQFGVDDRSHMLKLPVMGMPPREPSKEIILRIRRGELFSENDWFRDATVASASKYFARECLIIGPETVTITISPAYEFEVAEAEKDPQRTSDKRFRTYANLYFIQLMPNELPSYVIFLNSRQQTAVDQQVKTHKYRDFIAKGNATGTLLQLGNDGRLPREQQPVYSQVSQRTRRETLRPQSTRGVVFSESTTRDLKPPEPRQAQREVVASQSRKRGMKQKGSARKVEKRKLEAKTKRKPTKPKTKGA